MTAVHPGLAALGRTVRLLPRDPAFRALHIAFTGEGADPALREVLTLVDQSDTDAAHEAAQQLAHPLADLVRGITALQAGDKSSAVEPLRSVLARPPLEVIAGAVVLGPSDETMLVCEINALAAVPLLVHALAATGRYDEAIDLAGVAHRTAGAEGFLWLRLWLLRDTERWEELVEIADSHDRDASERFAIEFLVADALEALGRDDEAQLAFAALAAIDSDLLWTTAADKRLDALLRREIGISEDLDDDEVAPEEDLDDDLYDPLRPGSTRIETTDLLPEGPSPGMSDDGPIDGSQLLAINLALGGLVSGFVHVRQLHGPRADLAAATWLALLEELAITEVLDRLDDAIAEPVPLVGMRRRPDESVATAKLWQTALAALLAAATNEDDAAERLTHVLHNPETRWWADNASAWTDVMVTSVVGDVSITTRGGTESFVLPLVAKLHATGASEAAVRWLEWLTSHRTFPGAMHARVSVAYDVGDDSEVLRRSDGVGGTDSDSLVLRSFRARSLARAGRFGPALAVLGESVRAARRVDDDGDLERQLRYVRARVASRSGNLGLALADLASIVAVDSSLCDASEMHERLSRPVGNVRGALPLDLRRVVYDRYGGVCAQCSSAFDLQYDHIIPVAMGGATSLENLQLLCGACNRRKGAALG
ncbi:MAG: HNH endonuclease [Solirubrobacterales bacterium]|nr:HNH endonuclease [Solirubrobacterales bacterium]